MTNADHASEAGSVALDTTRGRLVIATTVSGTAVAMLTATVVNVALPTLASDLDATSGQQQWVVNAYLLALAALILIGGSLGDRYGRVRLYRIGVIWFGAASLLCAVAPNIEFLIGARFLQGIGGALLTPGSLAIIESTLQHEDRGRGVGLWSGLTGIAAAIGPLVGGFLVDISWRWVFLLNLPIAIAVIITSARVPESVDDSARGTSLDVGGAALSTVALGGMSFALIEGPHSGWSPVDLGAAALSVVAAVGLIRLEPGQDHPMIPFGLFRNREFAAANLITLLVYGGMGVVFFLLSIQLQVTAGWSALEAGMALVPVTVLMLLLSSRAGDLSSRIGPRWPLSIGPLAIAGGMLLFTRIGPSASFLTDVLPGAVVFGLGLSASVAPVTATALGSVPDDRSGAASGTNNAVSRIGQLLTVAAIPPLVGLTGGALSDPAQLNEGFPPAMQIGAVLVTLGSVAAFFMLREPDRSTEGEGHHPQCSVDAPHPAPVSWRASES
ncbi:MAG: MFS transporter [Actinobacteria bacterium]|nr:MAG: MFS transporter [Actinomycetota bacterium]REK39028.1 MAG: MFS transporter [Actinomycetota bacterium]